MAYNINHCRFSGTAQDIKQISTKTGTPMATFWLQCWKEKIKIVCFKDLAIQALNTLQGDGHIEVAGRLQSTSWVQDGVKRYGFQIIADEIKSGHSEAPPKSNIKNSSHLQEEPPLPPEPNQSTGDQHSKFDYAGGPF